MLCSSPDHTLRLLIAEKGTQYATLIPVMERVLEAEPLDAAARVHEFYDSVEAILQRERAAIEAPGRRVLGTVKWPRFVAWCFGRPRFPT